MEDNRWELMGKVSDWFKRNKIYIDMNVNYKHKEFVTSPIWWIHIMVVSEFSHVTTNTLKILQGHHVTVAMQGAHLVSMQTYL